MPETSKLNAARVEAIFLSCLFVANEDTTHHVMGPGITCDVGFHPQRLESHKAEVAAMLDDLQDAFKANAGGGMSFLNACFDKYGNQWTGQHRRMEQLFQLGVAIGKAKLLVPREAWSSLPGGMPYYVVH